MFKDKITVVTGGVKGIAKAICEEGYRRLWSYRKSFANRRFRNTTDAVYFIWEIFSGDIARVNLPDLLVHGEIPV